MAAKQGNFLLVNELINKGAGTNNRDIEGNTELFYAVQGGYNDIVDLLIEQGSNPNFRGRWKFHFGRTSHTLANSCSTVFYHSSISYYVKLVI